MTNNRLTMQELNSAKYIAAVFRDRKADQPTTRRGDILAGLAENSIFSIVLPFFTYLLVYVASLVGGMPHAKNREKTKA